MNKSRITKFFIIWSIIIFILVLMFIFSNQTGYYSNRITAKITEYIIAIDKNTYILGCNKNYIFRKITHFTEYFILGFFVLRGIKFFKAGRNRIIFISLLFCLAAACFDEVHQIFVPGRESRLFDIIIDSGGSLFGIVLSEFSGFFNFKQYRN